MTVVSDSKTACRGCAMQKRMRLVLAKYGDPRYLRWLLVVLSLIATILGIGACPDTLGGHGCGGV
jgi:hypothetical protein